MQHIRDLLTGALREAVGGANQIGEALNYHDIVERDPTENTRQAVDRLETAARMVRRAYQLQCNTKAEKVAG